MLSVNFLDKDLLPKSQGKKRGSINPRLLTLIMAISVIATVFTKQ